MRVTECYAMSSDRSKQAFTLIELLVVVVIIAVLVALLMPALEAANRQAGVTHCSANLKSYALGLSVYAIEDRLGKYPTHSLDTFGFYVAVWANTGSFYPSAFPDREKYMGMFTDMICGGNRKILFCPLERYFYNPVYASDLYFGEVDPNYPDLWFDSRFGLHYMSGYMRFANMIGHACCWANSGNERTDGPPTGMGSSQDAILADHVFVDSGRYIESHMDWSHVTYADAIRMRKSNNVAYSDGHVETHGGRAFISGGWLTWPGAHYVPWVGGAERLMY